MANSLDSSSLHIIASASSCPPLIAVSLFYLSFIYIIEFMLCMKMHLNNCSLHFVGLWFRIKFKCKRYSTSPKIPWALTRRKISQEYVWWKWTIGLPYQLEHSIFQQLARVNNITPWIGSLLWHPNSMWLFKM
jgi:hypothetical protein